MLAMSWTSSCRKSRFGICLIFEVILVVKHSFKASCSHNIRCIFCKCIYDSCSHRPYICDIDRMQYLHHLCTYYLKNIFRYLIFFNITITQTKNPKLNQEKKYIFIHVNRGETVPFPAWAKVSHMLGFLPSSFAAPSTFHNCNTHYSLILKLRTCLETNPRAILS